MRRQVHGLALGMCALLLGACVDTGGGQVSFPVLAEGVSSSQVTAGAWQLNLDEAQLAFGPLWLCAAEGDQASCETARAQFADAAVVDLLEPKAQELGTMEGTEGFVGTYWLDYGIVSLLTQRQPLVLPAAESLGGSLRVSGQARKGQEVIEFEATVRVSQAAEGVEPGVPVVRRASEDVRHVIDPSTASLLLRFDPAPLLRAVNFDAYAGQNSVVIEEPTTPQTAQFVSALRVALQGNAVPSFEWQAR